MSQARQAACGVVRSWDSVGKEGSLAFGCKIQRWGSGIRLAGGPSCPSFEVSTDRDLQLSFGVVETGIEVLF